MVVSATSVGRERVEGNREVTCCIDMRVEGTADG